MQTRQGGASWGVALIALLALAVCAKGLGGQNVGVASPPTTSTVDSSWPNVNLNLVVLDKRGVPSKAGQREIRLFEDGPERPLQFLDSQDSPVSLAFVIDSSGSIFKSKDAIIR